VPEAVFKKICGMLRDERGFSTPEALVLAALASLMGYLIWNTLRPYVVNGSGTLGGKVQNAAGSNNPTW
jgi:hypothetical protein